MRRRRAMAGGQGAARRRRQTPPLGASRDSTIPNPGALVEDPPVTHQSESPTHRPAVLAAANRGPHKIPWPPGGWLPELRRGPWESLLRRPRERVAASRLRGAGPGWRLLVPGSEGGSAGGSAGGRDGRQLGRWEKRLRPGCRRGGAAGPRSSQVRGRRARCGPLSPGRSRPASPPLLRVGVPVCPGPCSPPLPSPSPVSPVPVASLPSAFAPSPPGVPVCPRPKSAVWGPSSPDPQMRLPPADPQVPPPCAPPLRGFSGRPRSSALAPTLSRPTLRSWEASPRNETLARRHPPSSSPYPIPRLCTCPLSISVACPLGGSWISPLCSQTLSSNSPLLASINHHR